MVHSDLLVHERAWLDRGEIVVGIDEVGRGALAGPMVLGAVVLTGASAPPETLNDSKLLTALQREVLEEPLMEWAADWSLGSVSASEIDAWGLRLALAAAGTRVPNNARHHVREGRPALRVDRGRVRARQGCSGPIDGRSGSPLR